jgi:hypothetical protein
MVKITSHPKNFTGTTMCFLYKKHIVVPLEKMVIFKYSSFITSDHPLSAYRTRQMKTQAIIIALVHVLFTQIVEGTTCGIGNGDWSRCQNSTETRTVYCLTRFTSCKCPEGLIWKSSGPEYPWKYREESRECQK